jgi:hypothetical protein
MFSEQDLKTRHARASLLPPQIHRAPAAHPIYSPLSQNSAYSTSPPFLSWGGAQDMEAPRLYPRPISSASSSTTRTSFESRHKSPLSISSSIDYESSRTSEDSSFSDSKSNHEFLASRAPMTAFPGKRFAEPVVPAYSRYGAGGEGRRQVPKTLMTPQRLGRVGPQSPTSPTFGLKYTRRTPGEGFKKLPEEILLVVLAELKKLHLEVGSLSCATCWMRDLINLGQSCRKWWGAARCLLYEDIQLTGADSTVHIKKKFKIKYGTRLKLLRRTLRARPDLAEYVKSLKVSGLPAVL